MKTPHLDAHRRDMKEKARLKSKKTLPKQPPSITDRDKNILKSINSLVEVLSPLARKKLIASLLK